MNDKTKGRLIVFTGLGKGKTTAGLGLAVRAVGRGMKVLVIQFMKARTDIGEYKAAERLAPELEWRVRGSGFIYPNDPPSLERAKVKARAALKEAAAELRGAWDLVVLDEALYAIQFGLFSAAELVAALRARKESVHVVVTGGSEAPAEILELADTATEMRKIKHAFDQGVQAQEGIEF